jgi:catechol 2,3-dioxygenase-like lactoylglutathione lyase family enzyme
MKIQGLYAAVYVNNLTSSSEFYARVLGRKPDDKPTETLVQWRGFGSAGIQLFQDPSKAGKGIMTLVVRDLAATKSLLDAHKIKIDRIQQGDFGKITHITDPDGNLITLAEPPKSFSEEEGNNAGRHA